MAPLTKDFVPVGIDVYTVNYQKDAEGEWFLEVNGHISRPAGKPNKFPGACMTTHALTPSGKFLCGTHCNRIVSGCHPASALEEWKKLPESERRPGALQIPELKNRDVAISPQPPPGGLILKVHQSSFGRDAEGNLARWRELWEEGTNTPYQPGHDYVWLTEADARSMIPPAPKKGQTLDVPEVVADSLTLMLRDTSQSITRPSAMWSVPEDVQSRKMTFTVEEAGEGRVKLKLEGSVRLEERVHDDQGHFPDAAGEKGGHAWFEGRLLGYVEYDARAKRFTRFDVVALGDHLGWGYVGKNKPSSGGAWMTGRKPYVLGVAFQMTSVSLAPPSTTAG